MATFLAFSQENLRLRGDDILMAVIAARRIGLRIWKHESIRSNEECIVCGKGENTCSAVVPVTEFFRE